MVKFMRFNNIINKIKSINTNINFIGSFDENNLKTGYWETRYNGLVSTRGYYLNGLKHGNWKYFYNNFLLVWNCDFYYGKKNGLCVLLNQDGTIRKKNLYINDERIT